jgi:hypothetical protein
MSKNFWQKVEESCGTLWCDRKRRLLRQLANERVEPTTTAVTSWLASLPIGKSTRNTYASHIRTSVARYQRGHELANAVLTSGLKGKIDKVLDQALKERVLTKKAADRLLTLWCETR